MGDRISISFKRGDWESPALFSHWGGRLFYERAVEYAKELIREREEATMNPLDRLEPPTVMVDFIREITQDEDRVESNLYLGKDRHDGDNSDNGHHVIDLKEISEMPELERRTNDVLEEW